jgi:hypothetical protein
VRFIIGGPRLFGLRTGLLLGPKDLGFTGGRTTQNAPINGGFVYVIKDAYGLYKVGSSTNPTRRLAELQTAHAMPLTIAYCCAPSGNHVAVEKMAHTILAGRNVNLEWFGCSFESCIAAISVAAHRVGSQIAEIEPRQIDEVVRLASRGEPAAPWGGRNTKILIFAASVGVGVGIYVFTSLMNGP